MSRFLGRAVFSALIWVSAGIPAFAQNTSFLPPPDHAVGDDPHAVAFGDFNEDGRVDMVAANDTALDTGNPPTLSVLLGSASGSFIFTSTIGAENPPYSIRSADINGDGHPDLVIDHVDSGSLSILLGNGSGTFRPPLTVPRIGNAFSVAPAMVAAHTQRNGAGVVNSNLAVANSGSSTVSVLMDSTPPSGSIWATPVNAIAGLNSLTKSGGCDGCYDAGAATKAAVESGDAFADFRFPDTAVLARAGFAHAFVVTDGHSEDFAIRIQHGFAEVREFGIFRTDIVAESGAMFRIAIQAGVVTYAKNGTVFYRSSTPIQYPLVFTSILGTANSSIDSVVFSASTPPAGGGSGGPQAATWTSMAGVSFDGNSVQKSSGYFGCFDAFVKAAQTIDVSGYAEFTVDSPTAFLLAGLAHTFTPGDGHSIDYGIRIQGGYAEVRENGVYRHSITAPAGSVFRIEVSGGVARYAKDGVVFYSGPAAAGPFSFAALFANLDASISNAVVANVP